MARQNQPGAEAQEASLPLPPGKAKRLEEPVLTRELTTREKIILLEGSRMHGSIFPPWTSPPSTTDFQHLAGQPHFIDNAEFSLSDVQLEVFDAWRRPCELLKQSHIKHRFSPTMLAHDKVDLVQDVTTDCSVVASLCASTARSERGYPDIITSNMYPFDSESEQPIISSNGKYIFRLHFNGCFRKVVIDDRLPASRTSRALHVTDRNSPSLIWPALTEKAYLKIKGGYDFPGSNSGTDLWILTGWIPEQIFLQSDDISRNNLWRRTLAAFNYGDVLITMGTGKLTQCEEEGMGLAGEHDYAIIDMQEHKDQKLFLVKNPWSEGTVWRGHVYRGNAKVESGQALEGLCRKDKLSASDLKASSLAPGTFWMGLNDVFQSFESIYLNWNPGLFSHREDIHFQWDLSKENSPEGSFGSNPQYEVRSGIGGTVWLLLSRHFSPTIQGRAEGQRSGKSTDIADHGFISLYTFDSDGERVFLSDNANMRGPYVDSPNTLLKLELPAKRAHTVVISEQALPRMKKNFTLSAFSLSSLTLRHAREKYSHSSTHHGVWTPSTAGGNASSSFYHTNPQFSIQLVEQSDVSLLLENPTEEYPVHVKLVWAHGKQIRSITTRDIVGDSGEYRKGFAFAEIRNVQAGIYTVVCSTFEQGQLGRFSLRVGSGSASVVDRVPVESAGRFVSKIRSALFAPGVNRLVTPLTTHRLNRVSASARPRGDTRLCRGTHSPLKLALEYGQGSSKYTLVVSGDDEYDDCHAGLRTLDVDIQPSMCDDQGVFIVVERLGCSGIQGDERVDVELLSDGPVETGTWIEAE